VLRSISIMMALINFFGSSAYTQLVLFAKRVFAASDQQVGWLFAAGSAGVVLVGLSAGRLRRRLSFPVVALGALVVSGLCMTAMAYTPWYWLALLLWAANNGFGLLLNVNTGALRQAIVPNHLLGRIMSIAGVLAWSAIPLGALAGAAVIRATGDVAGVYAGMGLLTAAIAAAFAFSPIRHGERYLAEARAAKERQDRGDGAPAAPAPSLPADAAAVRRGRTAERSVSPRSHRDGAATTVVRVVLKAARNRSRKASMRHSGALGLGSSPSCQFHEEIPASTAGSCATTATGTWWLAPAPLTVVAGWWSPSTTRTRLSSCSRVTQETRAVSEYCTDCP
jgi:MFS family permease